MSEWQKDAAKDITDMAARGDHKGSEDALRAAEHLIDTEVRNDKGAKPTKTNGLAGK